MSKLVIDCTYEEFGADLLDTYDLDPIYPMAAMTIQDDEAMLKRFCLAYWCYYDAGVSSYVAEHASKDFYKLMSEGLKDWPRGMERRHFRGQAAIDSIKGLRNFGTPERVVDYMINGNTFQDISMHVQAFKLFGPWISWKIADMAERVLQIPVDFSDSNLGIYKDPRKGAAFIAKVDKEYPITDDELDDVVNMMLDEFHEFSAPPYQDRPVNVQEVETILCKYKAHCYGFYPMGNDSYHVSKSLDDWGDLAQQMKDNLQVVCTYLREPNGQKH